VRVGKELLSHRLAIIHQQAATPNVMSVMHFLGARRQYTTNTNMSITGGDGN
jgi:hypothetical protein